MRRAGTLNPQFSIRCSGALLNIHRYARKIDSTRCVMKIAKTQPDNKELINKNLVEFERQIVLVTK